MTAMEKIQKVMNGGKGEISNSKTGDTYYYDGEQWFKNNYDESGNVVKRFYTIEQVAEKIQGNEFNEIVIPQMREPLYEK